MKTKQNRPSGRLCDKFDSKVSYTILINYFFFFAAFFFAGAFLAAFLATFFRAGAFFAAFFATFFTAFLATFFRAGAFFATFFFAGIDSVVRIVDNVDRNLFSNQRTNQ